MLNYLQRKNYSLQTAVIFALLVMAFIASLFQLWEQDIFWQIRAGSELLNSFHLQTQEQWSSTANGTPWYNYQWLSTLIIAAIYKLGDVPGLIIARALILVLIMLVLTRITKPHRTSILILPLLYSALVPRIQIRPEFFVIFLDALIVYLWLSSFIFQKKFWASFILIILATNLHPGVTPFLILTAIAYLFQDKTQNKKLIYAPLLILAFFCTPYATQLPQFLLRHFFYQSNTILPNPEYFPMSLNDFNVSFSSLCNWSWLFITVLGYIQLLRHDRKHFFLIVFTALTILCLKSPRAIPFQIIFIAPFAAHYLTRLKFNSLYYIIVLAFIWQGTQIALDPSPLGLKIFANDLPDKTIEFIKIHHPQQNLLHIPAWGDSILIKLPEYKVFFDAREIPYDNIQQTIRSMFESPQIMQKIIQDYKINSVLFPAGFLVGPNREAFFPSSEWAIVSYDQNSVLLLKRIPEHLSLIKEFEIQ